MKNIIKQNYAITRKERNIQNGHRSFIVWFTGLSGSGKSTIANKLEEALFRKGVRTYSLDGDNIRRGLNKELDFSVEDRQENMRRIAEVGKLFIDAGIITLAAFISPLEKDRKMASEIIGKENFIQVFVNTPLRVCEARDIKGLYLKARQGEIENFTGINAPFEKPDKPDIEIRTENETVEEAVQRILDFLDLEIDS